jgi:hypothetical protein
MNPGLSQRIDGAFARYNTTISLIEQLMSERTHHQEVILLTCTRIDSLANLAFANKPQRDAFSSFLDRHSGSKSLFCQISVADLFRFLAIQRWLLEGTVSKAGRLHIFDKRKEERYILFLWNSGLPITVQDLDRFLGFIQRVIRENYRVSPTQSKRKRSISHRGPLLDLLGSRAKTYRRGVYKEAVAAIQPLVDEFSLGVLLYKNYRSGIIHELGVDIDESNFFKEDSVFWRTVYAPHVRPGRFLEVNFPGKVLLQVLKESVAGYATELKHTQRLPSSLFHELCSLDELKFLDQRPFPRVLTLI